MKKRKHDRSDENDKSHKAFAGKAYGPRNKEELPERQGVDEGKIMRGDNLYDVNKNESGTQGAYGQGNAISKGEEGAQGYGKYKKGKKK